MSRHRGQASGIGHDLETLARRVTEWAGSSWAFAAAAAGILVGALTRPSASDTDGRAGGAS